MQVGIMATDGGKHSDEYMAVSVAKDIIFIGANASKKSADEGFRLQAKLVDILLPYFKAASEFEHGGIDEKGTAHLASAMEVHPEIAAEAAQKVNDAILASPQKDWFQANALAGVDPTAYVKASVAKYIGYAQHMHRDWFARHGLVTTKDPAVKDEERHLKLVPHAKHDPECPHVQRWKDMRDGDRGVETIVAAQAEHNDIVANGAA